MNKSGFSSHRSSTSYTHSMLLVKCYKPDIDNKLYVGYEYLIKRESIHYDLDHGDMTVNVYHVDDEYLGRFDISLFINN